MLATWEAEIRFKEDHDSRLARAIGYQELIASNKLGIVVQFCNSSYG
jgi:hypothetical protein